MKKLNTYGSLISDLLRGGDEIYCIDIKSPFIKRLYAEKLGFVWADIVVGSRRSLYSAFDELNELFKQTNLKKLLEDHGYSLRNGRKYIFAIKQFKLDLF